MNTLEINDTLETYYDGRERFPHLPQRNETEKSVRRRRAPEREEQASKDKPLPSQH